MRTAVPCVFAWKCAATVAAAVGLLGLPAASSSAAPEALAIASDLENVLSLVVGPPQQDCYEIGETISVTLSMCCLQEPVVSYQAFLEFDPNILEYAGGAYVLPDPFGLPTIPITVAGSAIDLAAGINVFEGQPPAQADANLAVFTFQAIAEGDVVVRFRAHSPPTRMSTAASGVLNPTLMDSDMIHVRSDCAPPSGCAGDANCDGIVTWRDIDYFVAGMDDAESAWAAMFLPASPSCAYTNLDSNGDDHVTWRDIAPFVAAMNTICP